MEGCGKRIYGNLFVQICNNGEKEKKFFGKIKYLLKKSKKIENKGLTILTPYCKILFVSRNEEMQAPLAQLVEQ